MIDIHPDATIGPMADLEVSKRGNAIRIGPGCVIDNFVKIKFAGGSGDVDIGPGCFINSGSVIYSGNGVKLESNVLVGANCTLAATNHAYDDHQRLIRHQGFMASRGGILVEDDVWIGAGCILLDGTIIRRGAVIGAGSVVRGEVTAFAVVVGTPHRQIGTRGR
jgi:acetyltransferase-like isoleucine patch superfamily enzyme